MEIKELLLLHEGYRQFPYFDSVGSMTVGIGRNMETTGISRVEAFVLLDNDVANARKTAEINFPWFKDLDSVRQDVIVMLIFNMGLKRFLSFTKMINAIVNKSYSLAAQELILSKWARQVKQKRANDLSGMLMTGRYP